MSSQAETGQDVIVLRNPAAMLDYELAVADYCYGRDLASLYRALSALGISRSECRWHAAHPGQSRMCAYADATTSPHAGGARG